MRDHDAQKTATTMRDHDARPRCATTTTAMIGELVWGKTELNTKLAELAKTITTDESNGKTPPLIMFLALIMFWATPIVLGRRKIISE